MKICQSFIIIVTLMLTGCVANSGLTFPEKALIEPKVVLEAIATENELNSRKNVPIPRGGKWFQVVQGTIPVIITAPHATSPFREGKRRFSDGGGTAALALALGKQTGAHIIYTTYEGPSDPNYYDNNGFKQELARLVEAVKPRLILDIHGSHPYRSYDVDLGTMNGESLLGKKQLLFELIAQLNKEGIQSISYNRFAAAKNQTITKFSAKQGIPAIQLETNATYVSPAKGDIEAQRFSRLLQALSRYIAIVNNDK